MFLVPLIKPQSGFLTCVVVNHCFLNAGSSTLLWRLVFWSALLPSLVSLLLKLSMVVACVSYPYLYT